MVAILVQSDTWIPFLEETADYKFKKSRMFQAPGIFFHGVLFSNFIYRKKFYYQVPYPVSCPSSYVHHVPLPLTSHEMRKS